MTNNIPKKNLFAVLDDEMPPENENEPYEVDDAEIINAPKEKQSFIYGLYEYIETFCYALVLMILLFMFIFRYVSVDGESMLQTLHDEDKLVISNLAYTPKTYDIVVINHPAQPKPLIKRIIATEGQTVEIDYINWIIYVDDVPLKEDYIERESVAMTSTDKFHGKFTVEEGKFFALGDNRNNSKDSRAFGLFEVDNILGRVIFRVFPLSDFGKVD
ncbi:MAG: signal peptidase I [Firmicutes bacterium HGW-Firmicutes-21]|nr:MAG: signal peptidase I [Firmicutes bacterium HGW-Firmicutes-21]